MTSIKATLFRKMMKMSMDFNKPLNELRQEFETFTVKVKKADETLIKEVDASGVPGYMIIPEHAKDEEMICYYHGGGYCLGVYEATKAAAITLAEMINKKVLLVDYRVAPEAPFPSGIDDAMTAYKWLLASGYKSHNIGLYGESAGCGLALNTMIALREEGSRQPACATFSTPFLDATMSSGSVTENAKKDPYVAKDEFQIVNYYVNGLDKMNPMVSPLFHKMHGLAPIMIHVAEHDMLCDDGIRLYRKIIEAKGISELKMWPGMWHVFHMHGKALKESKKAIQEFNVFYNKFLG